MILQALKNMYPKVSEKVLRAVMTLPHCSDSGKRTSIAIRAPRRKA